MFTILPFYFRRQRRVREGLTTNSYLIVTIVLSHQRHIAAEGIGQPLESTMNVITEERFLKHDFLVA